VSSATGSLTRPPREVAQLRLRGARGGIIPKHRSMIRLRWTPGRATRAALLALTGFAGVMAALPAVGRLWGGLFQVALPALGLGDQVGWHRIDVGSLFSIAIPHPVVAGPWPGTGHFIGVGGFAALLVVLSLLLPGRFLPMRYFLRFLAAIQTVSIGYFAFATPPFPYPLPGYMGGLLAAGMAVLALVPIALGLGFYIFDHTLWRQLLLTVLVLGHLVVLLPLQALSHTWLIHHASLLVQPPLFFVFGLLVEILVIVGFYGWAMSWEGTEIPRTQTLGAAR